MKKKGAYMNTRLPTVTVRGLSFVDADRTELNELLRERLQSGNQTVIFTPNAKIGADALRNARLHALLCRADLLLPDGAGVLLASRYHADHPLRHRLPGIEAGETVLNLAAELGLPVYFFGGEAGIAEKAAAHWQKRLPTLIVAGSHHGYVTTEQERNGVLQDIRQSGARVLLVCLGFPAQEEWIDQNRAALPSVRLFLGLGGSFDVWAGKLHRAPRVFRALRMEWLWRMLRQPRRFSQLPSMLRYVFGRQN
ncbi:MAG: WecB/TagA/CpsF family glycosyltransferase [Ruminococcaceae bacterium]|nr:WecB/TagA/CpsF family glycosyltransferase [Oscillospiraceae bacterium]